jgi:hypothetical protein
VNLKGAFCGIKEFCLFVLISILILAILCIVNQSFIQITYIYVILFIHIHINIHCITHLNLLFKHTYRISGCPRMDA